MIAEQKNGDRVTIQSAYTGRVGIEGRASLVIENITIQDSRFFRCTLRAEQSLQNKISDVQLIVTGMV